jgi:hypothetical protein
MDESGMDEKYMNEKQTDEKYMDVKHLDEKYRDKKSTDGSCSKSDGWKVNEKLRMEKIQLPSILAGGG